MVSSFELWLCWADWHYRRNINSLVCNCGEVKWWIFFIYFWHILKWEMTLNIWICQFWELFILCVCVWLPYQCKSWGLSWSCAFKLSPPQVNSVMSFQSLCPSLPGSHQCSGETEFKTPVVQCTHFVRNVCTTHGVALVLPWYSTGQHGWTDCSLPAPSHLYNIAQHGWTDGALPAPTHLCQASWTPKYHSVSIQRTVLWRQLNTYRAQSSQGGFLSFFNNRCSDMWPALSLSHSSAIAFKRYNVCCRRTMTS